MVKRILLIALAVLMAISLIACDGGKDEIIDCDKCGGYGVPVGKNKCTILIGAEVLGSSHGEDCTMCGGTGYITCSKCNGKGYIPNN